ncbi:hypothetical protein [Pseudoclavibacter sp. 13-3]|uniref:hypothetical protein n=1 Tax=Pseudoclavibacter sp. 13-3 TaxID=2901228 RepID=UPI001E5AAE8C|nr:hypothetical protein [Pseudoclavibacter sp. 13-3]MCD7101957.1 hypothetical protein [Pseudoclavibacter sp. 13-3]
MAEDNKATERKAEADKKKRATADDLRRAIGLQSMIVDELKRLVVEWSPEGANRVRLLESMLADAHRRFGVLDAPWEVEAAGLPRRPAASIRELAEEVGRYPGGVTPRELHRAHPGSRLGTVQSRLSRAARAGLVRRIAVGVYAPVEGAADAQP